MARVHEIAPCLWFDGQAEEAVKFWVGIFEGSRIDRVTRYGSAGVETHGRAAGSVMTVSFTLAGRSFTALNGGPHFRFNEAISLEVHCETQAEIDYFWEKLGEGGDPKSQQCGWLKDRFGMSWQIVPDPSRLLLGDGTPGSERAMAAMLKMKKLDIEALQRAYDGR